MMRPSFAIPDPQLTVAEVVSSRTAHFHWYIDFANIFIFNCCLLEITVAKLRFIFYEIAATVMIIAITTFPYRQIPLKKEEKLKNVRIETKRLIKAVLKLFTFIIAVLKLKFESYLLFLHKKKKSKLQTPERVLSAFMFRKLVVTLISKYCLFESEFPELCATNVLKASREFFMKVLRLLIKVSMSIVISTINELLFLISVYILWFYYVIINPFVKIKNMHCTDIAHVIVVKILFWY